MGVMAYGYHPDIFHRGAQALVPTPKGRANPLAGAGTYAFLENTRGWKSEEICLAYALTEPCLASVQIVSLGTKSTIKSAFFTLTIWYSRERRCISIR